MMELFDLYLGFEVPWWNEAVTSPELKMPKTMKYLEDNFSGEEYELCKAQIMRGLSKGRDEMIKMTTRYLLKPPIIFVLLSHREYDAPLLRALLSVLHANPIEDDILIRDGNSQKWGQYIYSDPSSQSGEEKRWYNLLSKHTNHLVHWWCQSALNKECLVIELQQLSI